MPAETYRFCQPAKDETLKLFCQMTFKTGKLEKVFQLTKLLEVLPNFYYIINIVLPNIYHKFIICIMIIIKLNCLIKIIFNNIFQYIYLNNLKYNNLININTTKIKYILSFYQDTKQSIYMYNIWLCIDLLLKKFKSYYIYLQKYFINYKTEIIYNRCYL